jgi:hypothetical protein
MKKLVFLSVTVMLITGLYNKALAQGPQKVNGSFEMASKAQVTPVKAFYNVSTTGSDNVVLQLTPDQPFKLNARIVNAKGKVVQTIAAQDVNLRYAENIDVSKLPAGDYFIEIVYGDNKEKNHRIPFTK